jgi:Cu2+-containing amine oxidase
MAEHREHPLPLTEVTRRERAGARSTHPHDPLTADEIARAREILVDAGLITDQVRVPMLLPREYDKKQLAGWAEGGAVDRRVDVTLLDVSDGTVTEAVVSVSRGELLEHRTYASRSTSSRSMTAPPRSSRIPPSGVVP